MPASFSSPLMLLLVVVSLLLLLLLLSLSVLLLLLCKEGVEQGLELVVGLGGHRVGVAVELGQLFELLDVVEVEGVGEDGLEDDEEEDDQSQHPDHFSFWNLECCK